MEGLGQVYHSTSSVFDYKGDRKYEIMTVYGTCETGLYTYRLHHFEIFKNPKMDREEQHTHMTTERYEKNDPRLIRWIRECVHK